jgi:PAS domain S-box-containing protein
VAVKTSRLKALLGERLAIVGGGQFCRKLLAFLTGTGDDRWRPEVVAVVDPDSRAPGLQLARQRGIAVFSHHRQVLDLPGLTTVIEITSDPGLSDVLQRQLPAGVRLIDHIDVRTVWDALQLEALRSDTLGRLRRLPGVTPEIEALFRDLANRFSAIAERRGKRSSQIERELSRQQQTLAQIIQGSTIPTFVINRHHVVTYWNRALERLTGMPAREVVGTSDHWKPFRGNPRPLMADVIVDQLKESEIHRLYGSSWRPSTLIEGAYEAEEFLPLLGSEGKWCWFTGAPIKDPDGTIVGAIETLQDVTEKKRSETQCRRHTQKLATLCSIHTALNAPLSLDESIDSALSEIGSFLSADSLCLFMLEEDGRQWSINYPRGALEAVGAGRCGVDEMIGRVAAEGKVRFFQLVDENTPAELVALRGAGIRSVAYIPVAPEEGRIFGVIRMCSRRTNHFDEEDLYTLALIGNRIGAAVENALLNDELRRKNNFQSKLIRSSTDAIVATDETMRIVLFNPAAESLFGYARDDVVQRRRAFDLYPDQVEELWDAEADRDRNWEFPWKEITITRRNGEVIPVRYSGTLLHEGDRMMGSVAFFQDLREIKRLEAELLQSERLAAVGQTVAGMAHCIKNILHGLKGGSYMIDVGLARDDRDKLQSGWRMVQRNINRTSDLVLDLLSYSKEREPDYAPCDPNEVVREVCDLVQDMAVESDVALKMELDPAIGRVAMDGRTVHRCLLNLLSNAVDACAFDEDISKHHQVGARTFLEPGERIRFEVEDNGAGMSETVKQRLFTSFFSTKGSRGTGLGLLVTRKLIEAHRGTIEVASELGRGTRFTFYLPFLSVAQVVGAPAPAVPAPSEEGES